MTVEPGRLYAAAAVVAVMRAGGRATVATIRADIQISRSQTLRALRVAAREGLVFSRDTNVWTSTSKARQLYAEGQQQAAAA